MVPGRAVQPMLAAPAADVAAALAATGPASVEWKLDGARIQAHRSGGEVRLYTRNLNEITDRLGAVAALVADLPGGDLVLDGEVLGVDDEGAPRRFQDTMGDFGADAPTGPRARAVGVLLRRAPRRRHAGGRRAAGRAPGAAGHARAGLGPAAVDRDRRRRSRRRPSSTAPSGPVTRA